MKIKIDMVIDTLELTKSGDRGWYTGNCVYCGKKDHMGVNLNDKGGFNCVKCKEKGSIFKLLKYIDRMDLVDGAKSTVNRKVLDASYSTEGIADVDTSTQKFSKPIGFRRVDHHPYLEERGFTPEQYEVFNVGVAKLDPKYGADYVVFLVIEDGECKGHIGRSTWSKEKIKAYNVNKSGMEKHLRYKNSESDFGKLMIGSEEIVVGVTDTVILVEGLTDKASVDRGLRLYEGDEIKCCNTFGNKVSVTQLVKLHRKGIKNIVLFYDPDAVNESKAALKLLHTHFSVSIVGNAYLQQDAGDMSPEEIMNAIDTMKTSLLNYHLSSIKAEKI